MNLPYESRCCQYAHNLRICRHPPTIPQLKTLEATSKYDLERIRKAQALNGGALRPKHGLGERMWDHRTLYLLFLPVLAYYILIRYWPIALAWIVSFKDLKIGLGIWNSKWVGLANFRDIFMDSEILRVIKNSFEISLLRLGFGFLPPIVLAIVFHDMNSQWFKKATQTVVYIPHFFSWVVIYGIVFAIFSTGTGLVNNVFAALGLERVEFLMNKHAFRPILIGSAIWKELGWSTIIYLAALSTVDPQLYEAAVLDGAGPLKRIRYITLPSILPVITFVLCINLGFILFAGGEQILLFYNNAVYDVADIIDTWVYRVGLARMQFSIGTAVGLFQSFFGMITIIVANALAKRYTGRGIW
jgi:putative aldouronate transport system permease protein